VNYICLLLLGQTKDTTWLAIEPSAQPLTTVLSELLEQVALPPALSATAFSLHSAKKRAKHLSKKRVS